MSKDLPDKPRGAIAWMAGNSVASNLVMLMCLVGGFLALLNVKQEVFPDIEPDIVTVTVPYPGASPEEVEEGVLESIEEAVRSLDGVDEVTSVAREGSGTVRIEALLGADLQKLSQDVQNEVDRITTFPDEAEEPEVRIATMRRPVLSLLIAGDIAPTVLRELGERGRDLLLQDDRITQVELKGVPDLEIAVEISEEELRRYDLTLQQVARRIREASIDLPAGGLDTAGGEILVRVTERRDYGSEFARIPIITTADGTVVRLGNIATVDDGFEDTDQYTLLDGKLAVELEVYRVGDQTPLDVSEAVHERMDELRSMLPPGVIADIQSDRSEYYRERVELLLKNGAIGLALVLVVLGLFLEARLAFWVMLGIPISFLGSFLVLPSTGVTINMISLFAYIVALGIVVDDAIVVGENIYHYHQEGMPFHKAAVRGAREVAMPVTFSILTNVAAFMPMLFIPGVTGKIFMMIPAVVITVFLISLVESLFVLPAHLGHQKDRRRRGLSAMFHRAQQRFSNAFTNWVKNRYGPFLEFCLHHRVVTVTIAVAALVMSIAYAASGRMGFQLFPVVESDRSEATVVLPYGAPVEKTQAVIDRLKDGANEVLAESGHPELVESITADIGRGGSHNGRVRVELAEVEIREKIMSTSEFTRRWREAVGEVEGVEFLKFAADSGGPGSRGRPVEVQLSHRSIDVLRRASAQLASAVETYPRVKDVDDGFQPGKRQLDFQLTPEGKSLGLTAAAVARQARAALYGAEALRQQRGRSEIKVMVRLPEEDRSTEQTAEDLMIATPAGTYVPLRQVATMERGRAYTTIDRRKGRRVVTVTADVTPRARAGEVLRDLEATELKELVETFPGLTYSFEGAQADISESLGALKVMFPIALLAIYAMLAIPFRSYAQPLIVMVSIPFGIVGAFLGHLIMGYNLAIPSMFGIVALAGVVVNDSLVLVDFANRRRREDGMNYHDSVTAAGIQRFRPVVLTTLTTFGGLAPMIFETSRQARFLIPMALSLGFGILFATAITLILVPALYMSIEDITRKAGRLKRWLFPTCEPIGETLPQPEVATEQAEP
jgi:multidrug efflux pump subunit AcrB